VDEPLNTTAAAVNVLGEPLAACGTDPMTGWFRDGYCRTDARDAGVHVVCAELTETFLAFTAARGNDLSTPRPQFGFPGLNPGDRWCLCAARWDEAARAGAAPPVVLEASHTKTLRIVELPRLRAGAVTSTSAL
jgi:uncharacterized protein (DUF2237 family)